MCIAQTSGVVERTARYFRVARQNVIRPQSALTICIQLIMLRAAEEYTYFGLGVSGFQFMITNKGPMSDLPVH